MPRVHVRARPVRESPIRGQRTSHHAKAADSSSNPLAALHRAVGNQGVRRSLQGGHGGRPMDAATRAFFEPRFGANLTGVRVHTGLAAERSAKSIDARAYTIGQDIVFGRGEYAPHTHAGRALLAHELTHTLQQSGSVQRKIGDGHDLQSPRFAGDEDLEAAFDDKKDSIRFGHRGPKVTKIQIALTDFAIEKATSEAANPLPLFGEDGKFGPETKKAVQAFQASMGLPEKERDGIVGPVTMGLLDKQFPATKGSPQSKPTTRPADKKVVTVNFTVLSGSTRSVGNALNVANVLYAPANIEVKAGKIQRPDQAETEKLIGRDRALEEHVVGGATAEESRLFAVNQEAGVVSAYFVKDIREEISGNKGDSGYTIGVEEKFGFTGIAVQDSATDKTFAHELGHILIGFGHVVGDPNALMAVGGVGTQFSADEIAKMRNNPLAKSIPATP
jgi:peptidoglycan hydrolase-like protein with peptidoglycan-binding domain